MLKIPDNTLKELLVTDSIVTAEQFETAMGGAKRMGRSAADILIEQNFMTQEYYEGILATFYSIERANLGERGIDESTIKLLTEDVAREKGTIIFGKEADGTLRAAMLDPSDLITIEFLTNHLKANIKPFLASQGDFNKGISFYGKQVAENFTEIIQKNIDASLQSKLKDKGDEEAANDLPIVALTDNLLSYALSLRASDIHLEALEKELLVRFRIDGILQEMMRIKREVHPALVARFKLLAGLKLDEHFKPQDGRFRHKVGNETVDIRVSVISTFYGEKVEMRLLSGTARPFSFEELGIAPHIIKALKDNTNKTYGMVLITGPTGSGKTTTLYAVMNMINKTEVNIVTVEDPIEYSMKYVNQTQVNVAAGVTFANGLRSILRQDPNIIMVGEIRDEETAEIAAQAALTGHLVLSSLHTNDAPSAIPRFLDLGVEAFLAAAVLNAIMAQRLVRKICLSCIVSYKVTPEMKVAIENQLKTLHLNFAFEVPRTMFKGQGCSACGGTGYKSRMGIHEILTMNEAIRQYIVNPDFTLGGLRELARTSGYITMLEDGLKKVERGMTTLEEVLRVIRE